MAEKFVSNEAEEISSKPPIYGFFVDFNGEEPKWTLSEVLASVTELSLSDPAYAIHPQELKFVVETCRDFAVDKIADNEGHRLNVAEISMIGLYSSEFQSRGSFYSVLNAHLRLKQRKALRPFIKSIYLMMWALSKCPSFDGTTVYRGVRGHDIAKEYVKGKTVTW